MKKQDAVFYQSNQPQGNSSNKRVESSPITFRKSLKGFDTTEVLTYIEEREASYKAACEVYERTIEDCRRETKALADENARLTEENAALAEKSASFDEQVNEIEQDRQALERRNDEEYTIAQGRIGLLERKIASLEAELEQAKSAGNTAPDGEDGETECAPAAGGEAEQLKAEIEELKAENDNLRARAGQLMAENEQLKADAARAEEIIPEAEPAAAEEAPAGLCEETGTADILSGEIASLNAALAGKDERIKALEEEFTQYKIDTEAALAEAGNAKLQVEKDSEEITSLREINEKQAYEYAGRLNELETAAASEKLRIGKQVQLYSYHIDRISSLLEQANQQFAKAKEAVDELK